MPNSSSASKRMRQSVKRRKLNRVTKKVIKTATKRTLSSLAAKDFDKAATDIKEASSKIDKAGARRVLHPNTAARPQEQAGTGLQGGTGQIRASLNPYLRASIGGLSVTAGRDLLWGLRAGTRPTPREGYRHYADARRLF